MPNRRPPHSTAALVLGVSLVLLVGRADRASADDTAPVVRAGAGGYVTVPPAGAALPPDVIYQTANVRGKMPTNDWWSSLAWVPFSERQYPHPLALQAQKEGLRVFYPGRNVTGTKDAVFGFMPDRSGADVVLGHAAAADSPDARVDGWSDWFVRARFGPAGGPGTIVSYGHGSPFVYATFDGSDGAAAKLTFPAAPKVWAGDAKSAALGVTINGAHYALFAPTGSTWDGVGTAVLTSRPPAGKGYFSLAVLPDDKPATFDLFRKYAHAHVTDTRVSWTYDPKTAAVTTTFDFVTTAHEPGAAAGTLFALYPHQWRHAASPLLGATYPSVRGVMKLGEGKSFATTMRFPGVLPALPKPPAADAGRMAQLVRDELKVAEESAVRDTYWDGKWLGRLATVAPIAEQYGLDAEAAAVHEKLRARLEDWFTPAGPDGKAKAKRVFHYDARWGTLIGYPASFGSDKELNDHHFHYGYFVRAAAEVARRDPKWAADERFGGMVKLLVRDVASTDRADPLFPFLRNFDPYAGHTWASGHAKFGDGNNNESSSEAMNAWYGLILWAEATGDAALRDLGVWLYTTEMAAIQEYWFNVHGENFAAGYPHPVVTMVWGGKGANATWFGNDPEQIHGINFLPVTAGSLYLGHYPEYARRNYEAMRDRRGSTNWKHWSDVFWMYRALSDPDDAMRQFDAGTAATAKVPLEAGNSKANAYHWIAAMRAFGRPDRTVTADHPLATAFASETGRTYAVYDNAGKPRTVRFSDGTQVKADGQGWITTRVQPSK